MQLKEEAIFHRQYNSRKPLADERGEADKAMDTFCSGLDKHLVNIVEESEGPEFSPLVPF